MKIGQGSPTTVNTNTDNSADPLQQVETDLAQVAETVLEKAEQVLPQFKDTFEQAENQLKSQYSPLEQSAQNQFSPLEQSGLQSLPASLLSNLSNSGAANIFNAPATAPSNSSTVPAAGLKYGDRNANVSALQDNLISLGLMTAAQKATGPGTFGPKTQAAVEAFQKSAGVPVTGQFDAATRSAMVARLNGTTAAPTAPTTPAAPTPSAPPAGVPTTNVPGTQKSGSAVVQAAQQYLGERSDKLEASGETAMQKWVPANVDCANFVSAMLIKSGQITTSQGSASVPVLASNLTKAGWQGPLDLSQAQPGDVVTFDGAEGKNQHVEIYVGKDANGNPQFIGSNNVNKDGTQSITYDNGKWAKGIHIYHNPNNTPAAS
jgi:peptidoglycan hydrolase-like protein with peptidoglycan-binding domain